MVTLEELRAKHKQIIENSTPGGSKTVSAFASFSPAPSKNMIRILPGKEDALDFYRTSHLHKYKNAEGKWMSYHCREAQGGSCPMCDLMYDLWKMHRDLRLPKGKKSVYGDLATQIKPRPRYYVKAVIRDLEGTKDENGNLVDPVKFVAMSDELFDRVISAVTNPELMDEDDPENTTILSLTSGNDFCVELSKKGDYNSFVNSTARIKKTKAGSQQDIAAWMESPLNLDELIQLSDYEDGKKIAESLLASITPSRMDEKNSGKDSDDGDISDEKFKETLEI